jgi:nucleoside-diphosphate-sugar epimerase
MNVFVAGASGAIGRRLVPLLVAGGHEVVAMTHTREKAGVLRDLGARPVVADGLDRASVMDAVVRAEPEVVIHQMTGLAGVRSLRKLDDELALTNLLRTTGTDYLLDAARAAGAHRLIAQSYGLWRYAGGDGALHTEEDLLDPHPPKTMSRTLEAIRHVESAVPGAEGLDGLVLRYGFFYGPGTGIAADGAIVDLVRNRKWPIIGDGAGVWSFVHVDDAAAATMAAVDSGAPGVYNVADDEPALTVVWLPRLAKVLGAKPPRHVPAWVGRIAAGESGVYLSTGLNGLSNEKAKRELGWLPHYGTWRVGFRVGLGETQIAPAPAVGLSGRR